jgi:hypothetical protein
LSEVNGLGVLEPNGVVSLAEGRFGEDVGLGVANSSGGGLVVSRSVVRISPVSGLGAVSATSSLTVDVSLRDEGVVKSSGGEHVLGGVDHMLFEHTSGLFGDGGTEMSVRFNIGSVTSVAGNGHGFLGNRGLGRHIVSAGSVEVVVGPVEEVLLSISLASFVIADAEFSS